MQMIPFLRELAKTLVFTFSPFLSRHSRWRQGASTLMKSSSRSASAASIQANVGALLIRVGHEQFDPRLTPLLTTIQVHALDHRRPGRESQAAARMVERRLSGLIRHIAQVIACFTFRSITTGIAEAIYFDIIDGDIIVPDTMIVDGIVENPNGVASATCRRDRRALPNDADPLPVRIN